MTRDVISVRPNDLIEHAARMMAECDCGALPVVDRGGRLIGMVTDRDITVRLVARGRDTRRARVEDCMTDEVFSCHIFDSVEDCMQEMSRHQVRRLPIVDNRNRIVGIVSQADLARYAELHRGHGERRAIADTLSEISEATDRAYR
jgi:CBS-domain-containing membrane protein